ncbi:MAG TPA: hypothetical protein VFJ50_10280 [Gemmatimonadales bacterium]|nr:hypothetical protein [Gemmatimonadales bacterium]
MMSPRIARGWIGGLAAAVLPLMAPSPATAQLHGQHWTVTPETERVTVGDSVTIAFRVRLDERDLLFDTVPKPASGLPDYVRVLSVEKLQRLPDRLFVGKARVAFYRPGRQRVPVFELPFMRSVKGLSRGTLSSDTASVEVVPVLGAGSSATLRDIKEPVRRGGPDPWELLLGLVALLAAGWLTWRTRHRAPVSVPAPGPTVPAAPARPEPYAVALTRLSAIEGHRWGESDVARHYAEVTDVLRDYLEAFGVPARERTTSELRWALPGEMLTDRGRRRFEAVFPVADLVKFAHWRPAAEDAVAFLDAARRLLAEWHEAAVPGSELVAES